MRREDVAKHAFPLVVCALLNGAAYFQAKGIDALVSAALLTDGPKPAAMARKDFPRPARPPGQATSAAPALEPTPFASPTGPLVGARTPSSPLARLLAEPSCD